MLSPRPRILVIPGNPLSRLAVPYSFLSLMESNKLQAVVVPQSPVDAIKQLRNKEKPFDFVLLDLTQPEEMRLELQALPTLFPSGMKTGHRLALAALHANSKVRCVVSADIGEDLRVLKTYEADAFKPYVHNLKHVRVEQVRLLGRPDPERSRIIPCDIGHFCPGDPVLTDWVAAVVRAFPEYGESFRPPELAVAK